MKCQLLLSGPNLYFDKIQQDTILEKINTYFIENIIA